MILNNRKKMKKRKWNINIKLQRKHLKHFIGFFYGIILGLMFYELILIDLNFTEFASIILGAIITLMLSFGIAFSSQIRCISILVLPNFGGHSGRSVLKTLVFAYLLSGPVENLTINGKEVVRVFGCTTSLTYNLTKTRFELMMKPFADALLGLKADANDIKDTLRSIRDVAAPIVGEIEDENEMKKLKEENDYLDENIVVENSTIIKTKGEAIEAARFEQNYLKKVQLRCENQFKKAASKCRDMFAKGYDICYDTVTWIAAWLLCWPMKITFICNIGDAIGGEAKCDPSKHVDPGFGLGYTYLKNSRDTLSKNFKNVKMQYKLNKIHEVIDIPQATDTAKAIMHEVNIKKEMLLHILMICKRILAFIFIKIIITSQNYHDRYLREIEFDNFYITRYFKKIDARRKFLEKRTLLPLKKIERTKVIDPWISKPIKTERQKLFLQILKLFLEMVTATTIILLDRLFYEALDLVKRHAKVEYYQHGKHDMTLEVKGTGMIAQLLRTIVKGFNIKKRIRTVRSNSACLPKPSMMSNYYLYKIYGTYFVIFLFVMLHAYIARLRRPICAYFYRKREKRRILYLYNQTLRRRIGFFRHMKRKVKKMAREQRLEASLNVCAVLRIRFPKKFQWLKIFKMARKKCVICGEPEPFKNKKIEGNFEKCKTPNCYVVHCLECWNDMNRTCFACADSSTEYDDSEEED